MQYKKPTKLPAPTVILPFIKAVIFVSIIVFTASSFSSCNGLYEPVPAAPLSIDAIVSGDSAAEPGIIITWTPVADSGGYTVYRKADTESDYKAIGSTSAGQHSYLDRDEELELGSSYSYKVSSYGYWHGVEGLTSSATEFLAYLLTPVWDELTELAEIAAPGTTSTAIRTAFAPGNILYYAFSDSNGSLQVGRILEEEDEENAGEYLYELEKYSEFSAHTDSANPEFSLLYANGALYLGYADTDAKAAVSGGLSVLQITAEENDSGETDWDSRFIGTRGFSEGSVSSISFAAEGFGDSAMLYVGYIDDSVSGLQIQKKAPASGGTTWTDISPLDPDTSLKVSDAEDVQLLTAGSSLLALYTFTSGADTRKLAAISTFDKIGSSWSPYDTNLPAIQEVDSFSAAVSGGLLIIAAFTESDQTWNIVQEEDNSWLSLHDKGSFQGVFADTNLAAPFALAAAGDSQIIITAADAGGLEAAVFDQDTEKWFSYGSPGGSSSPDSPNLHFSNGAYYTAWVEDTDILISVGR
jgi:hypothetical protein